MQFIYHFYHLVEGIPRKCTVYLCSCLLPWYVLTLLTTGLACALQGRKKKTFLFLEAPVFSDPHRNVHYADLSCDLWLTCVGAQLCSRVMTVLFHLNCRYVPFDAPLSMSDFNQPTLSEDWRTIFYRNPIKCRINGDSLHRNPQSGSFFSHHNTRIQQLHMVGFKGQRTRLRGTVV